MVTKHWRQDWRFEPSFVNRACDGQQLGGTMSLLLERRGRWSQAVYQVDDRRVTAVSAGGKHNAGFSTWVSGETSRPLPRREWSVRKDYQLLVRHQPPHHRAARWLHEENNLKRAAGDAPLPFVGREYGVCPYEPEDADFAAADAYYQSTREYWFRAGAAWNQIWSSTREISVAASSDQSGAFAGLFELADEFAAGRLSAAEAGPRIRAALSAQGIGR